MLKRVVIIATFMAALGLSLVSAVSDVPFAGLILVICCASSALLWTLQAKEVRKGRMGILSSLAFGAVSPFAGAILSGFPFYGPLGSGLALHVVLEAWYLCIPVGVITGLLVWNVARPATATPVSG